MIWQRYFLKELAKVFLLFMGGFYFLYVLIDYSTHTKAFKAIALLDISLYYLYQLAKMADILVPIALLLSTVKVLTSLNIRNELVALLSGGLPLKRLMRPFLLVSAFCALLLYLNFQYVQPRSIRSLLEIKQSTLKEQVEDESIGALPLADNSLLIYQKYDHETDSFFDAYWYKSPAVIYRIHELFPYEEVPFGKGVARLERVEGQIKQTETFETLEFPKMRFDKKLLFSAVHPPRSQSLTQLFSNISWHRLLSDKGAETLAIFLYKLTLPLACLLVVIAPAPFCTRFGRHLPAFAIYALSLFGIITFFTFVNACVILGQNQVIHPIWTALTPFGLFFGIFGWRYAKL